MLLEIAVGDAFGACYEWTDKWIINKYLKELRYITLEENPSLIKPGNYTDDTQMTLAIAEYMLENKDVDWDHYGIADKFVECFHRDPRRGYAPGFYLFLLENKTGINFLKNIHPTSTRSGAAMRAAPLGLLPLKQLKSSSLIQSSLTHNTSEGCGSALCAAAMVHYFRYDLGPKSELLNWLDKLYPMPWLPIHPEQLKKYEHIPVEGWPCVTAAIDAIMRSSSLTEVLINGVSFAGDTDTICAIAMGPASLSKEIKQDLPQNLIDGLENGKYGRDYIIELDKRLLNV